MRRVAIGGLHTECSSYSPLEQTDADFTRIEGDALLDAVNVDFAAHGIAPVPIFQDRSVPGGPVSAATWQAQTEAFYERLRDAGPVDGVLLLMHGAMFVPGVPDPEGAFLREIRRIVGEQAILSASFDLHGQVTQALVDTLDIFAAYRTAPHVDVAETHGRAAHHLTTALSGGPRPRIAWEPIPILVSGEMSSTFVAPCDALYARLPGLDRRAGVWDCNLMVGYVWADSPRATAAAVVSGTDPAACQRAAREIADAYRRIRDQLCFDPEAKPLPEALDAVAGARAILADSGDNPTAGGVGDRADVLSAALERDLSDTLFAGIADPVAFAALSEGAARIELGGSLGGGGPRCALHVEACRINGDCAVLRSGGLSVVVTARRRPFHHIRDFDALGLDLDRFGLLVVKSGYLSPDLRQLPRRVCMALTDGAVCQNIERLENRYRPPGTWPFQP